MAETSTTGNEGWKGWKALKYLDFMYDRPADIMSGRQETKNKSKFNRIPRDLNYTNHSPSLASFFSAVGSRVLKPI